MHFGACPQKSLSGNFFTVENHYKSSLTYLVHSVFSFRRMSFGLKGKISSTTYCFKNDNFQFLFKILKIPPASAGKNH